MFSKIRRKKKILCYNHHFIAILSMNNIGKLNKIHLSKQAYKNIDEKKELGAKKE